MNRPLVWGHRGASGYEPENTLRSFERAADMKADGVELDIQLTRDGKMVVCHDETIDRTSNGTGFVKDHTFEELRALDFSKTHPEAGYTQIPTMKEVFELLKPTGLTINVELKTGIFDYEGIEDQIVKLTHQEGWEDRVIYSSFNHASIRKIQKLDPQAKTAFLYGDGPLEMPAYGKKYGVDALHPAFYNIRFPGFMDECRRLGLDVNVWTVNEEVYIRMCMNAGVHAIIGNYPDRIWKVINER